MATQELVEYIKRQLSQGHNVTTIREHLLKHNYPETTADEALHKATEEVGATIKHPRFPFKKMAYAFITLFVIIGIGFGIFQMFGSKDLAGAATEAEPSITIETQSSPEEEQEILIEEPIEEVVEQQPEENTEQLPSEELVEENVLEETTATEIIPTPECTNSDDCTSAYVCYQNVCEIDNDRDLVSDTEESLKGTNTLSQDTDSDGYFDYTEFDTGTDPLDSASPGYTSCSQATDCAENQACNSAGICTICSDIDAENYKKKTTSYGIHYISGNSLFTQDACTDSGKLLEFFCTSDNYLYYKEINCEQEFGTGYYCNSGKCMK
ncbi:MAG: hypothetical protein WC254_04480 [Candidatus Woesearchaeota archaeon]|jgi:hypothetical protein